MAKQMMEAAFARLRNRKNPPRDISLNEGPVSFVPMQSARLGRGP